jgi:hypothetical protein
VSPLPMQAPQSFSVVVVTMAIYSFVSDPPEVDPIWMHGRVRANDCVIPEADINLRSSERQELAGHGRRPFVNLSTSV